MISLKLAFRSVFRRPKQNLAVIMGITLGVSLFAGVQIGGDSLSTGFVAFAQHGLGDIDAQITSPFFPFFVTQDTLLSVFNGTGNPDILSQINVDGPHQAYIKSIAERLRLSVTVIEESTGSTEISKSLVGMSPSETGFGKLTSGSVELVISDLKPGEVYIGEETAKLIFLDEDPVGKNLTISVSFLSLGLPPEIVSGVESIPVGLTLNVRIVGVFDDEGKGRENFADYLVTDLSWLQSQVNNAILQTPPPAPGVPVISYGDKPITSIIINWKDEVDTRTETREATKALEKFFNEWIGSDFSFLYVVSNTRTEVAELMEDATDQITTILNVFGSLIIFAGILVIINIQSMALSSREKETGILRAIGSKRKQIIVSNLSESMLLGVFGSILGLLGGALYGKLLVIFMGVAFDFPTGDIPTVITQNTLIKSFVTGFVLSQVTGILPAIMSSRINIAQVLRGLKPPSNQKFGRYSLYFGILFTVIAISRVLTLDPNPILDGKDAFINLDDTEKIYLPVAYLILGPSLLMAYFYSKKIGLTILSVSLLIWANFNIFVVFGWIETGQGGFLYVLYLIGSLVIGSILLFGMNLNAIATFGQKITSIIVGSRNSSLRGTSMVAFQKMTSKATRSTLTFALFATILTLNIFIGTWSYSFRYGFDQVVVELSSGSDILLFSDRPIADAVGFDDQLLQQFKDQDTNLKFIKAFTMSEDTVTGYLDLESNTSTWDTFLYTLRNDSLTDDTGKFMLQLNLLDNKTGVQYSDGTSLEYYENKDDDAAYTQEDEDVWKAFVANQTVLNKNGEPRPMILTTFIFEGDGFNFQETNKPGDSVYLNLTDGSVQEFVIASTLLSNPLLDLTVMQANGPAFASGWFINDYWAGKVEALAPLKGYSNVFLGKTNVGDITSDKIDELVTKIEIWANQQDGDFRKNNGLYGIVGLPVYDIYEVQLDGQYRFFLFLQAFVSLGFIVGILGLLVVASRSVAERTREIGMLRALGFRRIDVVISVVLELVVMGLIGLVIGFINGTILGYALTDINSGGDATFLIPWGLIGIYAALTFFSAIVAAIFPAIKAAKIPPSDALRYIG